MDETDSSITSYKFYSELPQNEKEKLDKEFWIFMIIFSILFWLNILYYDNINEFMIGSWAHKKEMIETLINALR